MCLQHSRGSGIAVRPLFLAPARVLASFSLAPTQLAWLLAEEARGLGQQRWASIIPLQLPQRKSFLFPLLPEKRRCTPGQGTVPLCPGLCVPVLEASGSQVGGPSGGARSGKAHVPTGGRVMQQQETGRWADPGGRCPHLTHHCPTVRC